MHEKDIKVAGFVSDSVVDGPGLRFALFVQGCQLSCEGCHNPQTQNFEGGTWMSIGELFAKIENNPLLDGVTLSGGEPLCQAKQLLPLVQKIKDKDLHLAVYTGFVFEKLLEINNQDMLQLLQFVDVLIDGPFVQSLKSHDLKFKGSKNQRTIDVKQSLMQKRVVLCEEEAWV